jgi:hypothetical protein
MRSPVEHQGKASKYEERGGSGGRQSAAGMLDVRRLGAPDGNRAFPWIHDRVGTGRVMPGS